MQKGIKELQMLKVRFPYVLWAGEAADKQEQGVRREIERLETRHNSFNMGP
jgi:hypothetical protein